MNYNINKLLEEINSITPDIIIKNINCQNNSINGILFEKNKKRFFKIISNQEMIKEEKAINLYSKVFPIKKHLNSYHIKNDLYLIIYEYDLGIKNNDGLLNDYFVKNDFKMNYNENKMNKILSIYNESSKKRIWNDMSPIDAFFKDRINSRLINWYDNEKQFNKKVVINGYQSISTSEILEETKKYFQKNKQHLCFVTQGDHNSLNISTTPYFFDISLLGYNYAIGEFAICLVSILIFDQYICPKYHPKSFYNHDEICKKNKYYKPKINYRNGNLIEINGYLEVTSIRKQYILKFLEIIKDFDIYDDLIYFIVMRLMCIFNISKFDKDDYYYIIFLVHYFYNKLKNNNYNNLHYLIDNLDELRR